MNLKALQIHINGIVQGVGFRPFVYTQAILNNLHGWVRNSANGVDIEVVGTADDLENFKNNLQSKAPPLSEIDSIETNEVRPGSYQDFRIIKSENNPGDFIPVSPDMATCKDCLVELFDPEDRRYRYPFINCTNCGPRFSIIKDIPYDRPKTTMVDFLMCLDCKGEYENPLDRRFHAQPVACSKCGPQVWLENPSGEIIAKEDRAIQIARTNLKQGKILAIKGLGGFHLACDAKNSSAVKLLRERKKRSGKPFALMAANLEVIRRFVNISKLEEDLLTSPQSPILLMVKKKTSNIATSVSPHQNTLGVMLPYTPLHHLLLEPAKGFPDVLVMTSGNLSEEPILHNNALAQQRLNEIADLFLMHDRPIHSRIDDSVMTLVDKKPYFFRRARGYAPNPIRLSLNLPKILAVGPQMKNTFCLTRDNYAFLSHYIGEMENWETYQDFKKAIEHYETLFRIKPQAIAHDLHPDYLSTRYAKEKAVEEGLPIYGIQHHHAHLVAAMVENNLPYDHKVAGLIFDGTGYGLDGTIWGGEILVGNCESFERFLSLKPVPLPGSEAAIKKPARMALSTLWAYDLPWNEELPPVKFLSKKERSILLTQLENGINAPMTSSMGRFFDTISALIDVRETITYEAQAAMELEALVDPNENGYYPWEIEDRFINVKSTLQSVLDDYLLNKTPKAIISARFHNTLAQLSLQIAKIIENTHGIDQIVLSGGVWQNITLLNKTMDLLKANQFQPIIHHQMPPNDGCVSFGQAIIAAYRFQNKEN